MRTLLASALLIVCSAAPAQTSFRLVDPLLSVDGRRVATQGDPLVQAPFGVLTVAVPGVGTYTISERPFAGARRAGQFDGAGLYFATAGRSVRLISREDILSLDGPASAYVRYEPSSSRARGPARLSIADDAAGRGRRPITSPPARAVPASGPRPSLSSRPAARAVRDAEVQRLLGELDRLVADRQRLAAERDRLLGERNAAQRAPSRATASRETAALSQSLARLTAERDRLARERDQLADALARSETERAELAAEFGAVRRRAEAAEASAAGWARSRDADASLRTEMAELRAALQDRDRAIDRLRAEQDDRSSRLPSIEVTLADLRSQLAAVRAERDRALGDRDRAFQLRDDAVAALDRSVAETDALRAERDRLLANRPAPPVDAGSDDFLRERAAVAAEREALIRDRALLDADRATLAAERDALEAMRDRSPRAAAASSLDDRQALLDQLAQAQTEREALLAERDRLQLELQSLRTRPAVAAPAPVARPRAEPRTIRTPSSPSDGAIAFLPGFDFGRLGNPDVIRRRLDEAEYPRWATVGRIEGDVLVLFQTDRTGRVVSTAVPTPIGGGLDGLAEEIVREMRFAPTSDSASGLRSQVVVRFEL